MTIDLAYKGSSLAELRQWADRAERVRLVTGFRPTCNLDSEHILSCLNEANRFGYNGGIDVAETVTLAHAEALRRAGATEDRVKSIVDIACEIREREIKP
jgi:hypothetical protein